MIMKALDNSAPVFSKERRGLTNRVSICRPKADKMGHILEITARICLALFLGEFGCSLEVHITRLYPQLQLYTIGFIE